MIIGHEGEIDFPSVLVFVIDNLLYSNLSMFRLGIAPLGHSDSSEKML